MRLSSALRLAALSVLGLTVGLQASYLIVPSLVFPSSGTPAAGTSTPPANGANSSGTTTISINLTPAPTVGNIVVVGLVAVVNGTSDQTHFVTDNQSGAYSKLLQFPNTQQTANVPTKLMGFCSVVKASVGTFTITATESVASAAMWIAAKEYKNTTCNQDVTAVGATGNTHPYSCGSLTTINPKDIVLALVGYSFGGGGTNTFTAPAGFTLVASQPNGNLIATGSMAENITSAAGTFNGTYDATNVVQPSVSFTPCAQFAIMSH
jgi:hypothetical protein